MGKGNCYIDAAQVVLEKYPEAYANELEEGNQCWEIRDNFNVLSSQHADRDEAWREAAQRIRKW